MFNTYNDFPPKIIQLINAQCLHDLRKKSLKQFDSLHDWCTQINWPHANLGQGAIRKKKFFKKILGCNNDVTGPHMWNIWQKKSDFKNEIFCDLKHKPDKKMTKKLVREQMHHCISKRHLAAHYFGLKKSASVFLFCTAKQKKTFMANKQIYSSLSVCIQKEGSCERLYKISY